MSEGPYRRFQCYTHVKVKSHKATAVYFVSLELGIPESIPIPDETAELGWKEIKKVEEHTRIHLGTKLVSLRQSN